MNKKQKPSIQWSEAWKRYLESYLKAPPRAGLWLAERFSLKGLKVLEIGAGSCRDSLFIADMKKGPFLVVASDSNKDVLEHVRRRFPESKIEIRQEDAFNLSFDDAFFDITFCNGLWVLFSDEDVLRLLREQARVTRKFLVSFVHNRHNAKLLAVFQEKAKQDKLYDVRFFTKGELLRLVAQSGVPVKKVSVEKFGGAVDKLFVIMRWFPLLKSFVYWLVPKLYRFQPWSMVERCALVIEIERDS